MKRFIALFLLFLYTTLGSGATGLLHFCHVEEGFHVGLEIDHEQSHVDQESHHCCSSPTEKTTTCPSDALSSNEEPCCESLYIPIPETDLRDEVSASSLDIFKGQQTLPLDCLTPAVNRIKSNCLSYSIDQRRTAFFQRAGQLLLYH